MLKAKKLLIAVLITPLLGACAAYDLDGVNKMEQQGDTFDQALHKEYMALAYTEAGEQDWDDAAFFAAKAKSSAEGISEDPQSVSDRNITGPDVGVLNGVRSVLMEQLGQGRKSAPESAARAQAMFDCWLQEREENIQPKDIKKCREDFNIAFLKLAQANLPATEMKTETETTTESAPVMAKEAGPFMVFFGFDSDALDKTGLSLVEAVADNKIAQDPNATILISGFADRSGTKKYNMALSDQRAISVSIAIQLAGAKAKVVTESFGEDNPLKPTDDGVREPKNRRVEIRLTR